MNFNFIRHGSRTAQQRTLGLCALAAIVALPSCGGSSSNTALKNDLPSPVAEEIKGGALVPAPDGNEPVPATELAALPTINVKQRQFADANVLLNLSGSVTAATGATIDTTLWTQVTGPAVRIPSPLQLNNEIIIPDVAVATTLEFRLTAQDSKGKVNSATVSILVKPVPSFVRVIGGVFNEVDKVAVFTLRLNAASSVPTSFSYSTQDGTASNGSDYTLTAGQIIFAAGETSKTISVPLLDDTLSEDDETFSLQVTALDGDAAHSSSGVAIIHSGAEALLPQTISFTVPAATAITVNSSYSNPLAASPGTGAVIYTSSNPQVATVDANGLVTALTPGTVTITASKAGDATYASAVANYQLQVVNLSAAPIAAIAGGNISVSPGSSISLQGGASDLEDGTFPYDLLDQSQRWNSSLNGFLGYGSEVTFQPSTIGWNLITYTATDSEGNVGSASTNVFVGNIAHQAIASAGEPNSACYSLASAINDSNPATAFILNCGWTNIYLAWPSPVSFDIMEIYSTLLPSSSDNLLIEYFDSNASIWRQASPIDQILPSISYRILAFSPGITTNQVRISRSTSASDPIKEITVYNSASNAPADTPSSARSSSASSSSFRSSVANSSSASTSSFNPSTASSSVKNSSAASSSAKSSSVASSSISTSSSTSSSNVQHSFIVTSSRASSSRGIILL